MQGPGKSLARRHSLSHHIQTVLSENAADLSGLRSFGARLSCGVSPIRAQWDAPARCRPLPCPTVTMRRAGEDMTPEEHKRRGDAADALFQDMKRAVAAALKKS